jgi:heptosyltransferase-2
MKRVLVAQTAFLGDVVLAQPLWAAVKRRWPDAEVDVLMQPQWAPLFAADPAIHETLTFDKRGRDRGFTGLLRLAAQLRARHYDAALCPHPSFRSGLLLRLAGIPQRLGFDDSAGRFFHTTIVRRDRAVHEVDRALSLLAAFEPAAEKPAREPRLVLDPALTAAADSLLAKWDIPIDRPFACAHPGSVWATKRWLPEGFAEALSGLADAGQTPVVIGGPADIELANLVQDRCRTLPVNLAGRLSLPELALLLSRAAVLITNDSGPMHVAGALGTPVVAIFGSTVPALGYGPVGSPSRVVEVALQCRPCGPHGFKKCPLGHFNCMKKINPAEVVAAAAAVAKRQGDFLTGQQGT